MNEQILDTLEFNDQKNTFYPAASKSKRFANYFIDLIGNYIVGLVIGVVIALAAEVSGEVSLLDYEEPTTANTVLDYLLGVLIMTMYYTLCEYFLKGKTLGKYITKTRAVTEENARLSPNDALVRSLCRLIPFEAFSFLGERDQGWHDSIAKTKVIEDNGWVDY